MGFRAIEWIDTDTCLRLLDQTVLPGETRYLNLTTTAEVAHAIQTLTVRGAPAIGVAAAFGALQGAVLASDQPPEAFQAAMAQCDATLRAARPTAVNLFWALDQMRAIWQGTEDVSDAIDRMRAKAMQIEQEDIAINEAMSRHAMEIVPQEATFFHHCNTGALATVDRGTALGVIRTAHETGRKVFAYIDETRPRMQGSKLSSFELMEFGVPHAIVVDGASAHIMRTKHVDLVVVGADRVAANGDTANKIGTYNLALAARDNNVPFYVVAPTSTIDMGTATGDDIDIEIRDTAEITEINGTAVAPQGAPALNLAFDITPNRLISGIITEHGIVRPSFEDNLKTVMR